MQHLTKEELKRLLGIAYARSDRDFLMILVAFNHGLRVSETINLTCDNIRDGFLIVKRLKGSLKTKQELIVSHDPLFNEAVPLQAMASMCGKGVRLFPITRQRYWQIIKECGKLAGIPEHKCHPHVLKHTVAMLTIKNAGIENVRQYLGHKSISSTGAYLKVDDAAACKAVGAAMGV